MKIRKITEYFDILKCKSDSLEKYSKGNIPFISSTILNNGVERFVESINEQEIIKSVPCIVMNGFGFCTVQTRAFIGAGNNGAYVKALIPKKKMGLIQLSWYAAQINLQSWRFSYGRLAIKERVQKLELTEFTFGTEDMKELQSVFEEKFSKLKNIFDS